MVSVSQKHTLEELKTLSESNRHSILIEGVKGCGKTFIAGQYAKMLEIPDFQIVEPKVQDIREASDECSMLRHKVVLCIENLDLGTLASSYTLLKFLEEPSSNVYVVVTCRNVDLIPDTILSRCDVVTLSSPIDSDLENYGKMKNLDSYLRVEKQCKDLLLCASNFSDVDSVLAMTSEQIQYFADLEDSLSMKEPISNKCWKLQKYKDGSELPVGLAIQYLMMKSRVSNPVVWFAGNEALQDISMKRISVNAIIAKFLLICKYGS